MFNLWDRQDSSAHMPTIQPYCFNIKGNLLCNSRTSVFFSLDDKHCVRIEGCGVSQLHNRGPVDL